MRYNLPRALRVAAILGEYITIYCLPSCLMANSHRCLHMATGAAQAGGSFRILAGIAALSDYAGMISIDGGGTVCGSGGNVRVATGKGVDRDSGNIVMATAAAGSDAGASGAVALKTGCTSAGSSGALSLTTGTAVLGSGAIPVFVQARGLPLTHHTL